MSLFKRRELTQDELCARDRKHDWDEWWDSYSGMYAERVCRNCGGRQMNATQSAEFLNRRDSREAP